MRDRSVLGALLILVLTLVSTLGLAADASPQVRVFRVYYETPDQIALLQEIDLFESNNVEQRYVLAIVHDDGDLARLQSVGLRIELDRWQTEQVQPAQAFEGEVEGIPGFPCYRTVEETYAVAEQIVAEHPTLAEWNDIGDSWEKANGFGGYDLRVLKLTNQAIPGPKPKLFITASIHAREYTPGELTTRFGELLIDGYGVDADATWILDFHEVHLVMLANPDARKQAEAGLLWRKNMNQNYCDPTSTSRGADLNRNFDFEWNCCNGSSGNPCSTTYRGPFAASEPEVTAYQDYLRQEFPDQRGPALTDPAPDDATGVYLDIHSSGQLIMWPWGFPGPLPNETAFTTFGRKLAFWNGYTPQRITGLGTFDGVTADFGYGELGIAAMAYELGTTFFQNCSFFDDNIVPGLLPSLVYAAKVSRTPFLTPAGPDALELNVSGAVNLPGALVTLTATIDDTRFNNSNGSEPTQGVTGARYTIDTPPWEPTAPTIEMTADDGAFDASVEAASATIDTSELTPGRHTVFVVGRDASSNEGAVSAVFVDLLDPAGDEDSDGTANAGDCALYDESLWSAPGPAQQLALDGDELTWVAPPVAGSTSLTYDLLRSASASGFAGGLCVKTGIDATATVEPTLPNPGETFLYLIRSVNGCGSGLAPGSGGNLRTAVNCFGPPT